MITIHTSEFWINEPIDFVIDKIRRETLLVEFGPFNVFNTKHQNFYTKWIGEIDRRNKKFKLFRVTDRTHTSDVAVHGEYTVRINKPMIVVRYKVHFTAFLGLFGLLAFGYAVWYLLRLKGVILGELGLIAILLTVGMGYSISTIRDLNKCAQEIERVIYKIVKMDVDEDDEDDADDDDG